MSSKNSSFKVRTAMNKKPWAFALSFISFFFALPIYAAIALQNFSGWRKVADGMPGDRAAVIEAMKTIFSIANIPVIIIICIGALVSALAFLSYMNNRRQVDFYHSMPTSREKLFFVHIVSGVFSVLIPYLINLGLALCVVFALGMGELLDLQMVCQFCGITVLFFVAILSLTAFSCVVSGNTVMAGLLSVFLLSAVPIGSMLIKWFIGIFYPTYYADCYNWDSIVYWGSPITRYISNAFGYEPLGMGGLLIVGCFVLIVFLLAMLMYKKRPSEGAGHAIAFLKAEPFIKYPVVFLFTLGFSILFHEIGDDFDGYAWLIFGAMAGALLSSQIGEIIFNGDFRAYRKHLLGIGVFAALVLTVIICGVNDVTGYNSYVPRANDIVQVNIKMNGVNNFAYNDYIGNYYYYDFLNEYKGTLVVDEIDRLEQGPIIDEQGIEAALSIVEKYIQADADAKEDDKIYPADQIPSTSTDNIQTASCYILYTLADGSRVARQYNINNLPIEDIYDELCIIYGNPLFRDAQYPAFDYDDANTSIFSVYSFEAMGDMYYGKRYGSDLPTSGDAQSAAVLKAFEQDLKGLTPEYMRENMPIGMITISVYEQNISGLSQKELQNMVCRYYDYPIFADFSATLAVLEDLGYEADFWNMNKDDVQKIIVNNYDRDWNCTENEIYDAEEITEILENTYNSEASYYNSFINVDQYHTATVIYKEQESWRTTTRIFPNTDIV